MKEIEQFFKFVNEREHIRIAKESGAPQFMWTQDPVLQQFRFCNIFREDDKTTRYFRDTVRDPLRDTPFVLPATIGWRWFNKIETCGQAKWWTLYGWKRELAERDFRPIQQGPTPLVTGAYLIKTPNGTDKLTGILDCMDEAMYLIHHVFAEAAYTKSLEDTHAALMRIPYLGRFMAYEIVTDLRHTYLLEDASDIDTWASAGPGCARGLGRVNSGDVSEFSYGSAKAQQVMLKLMHTILWESTKSWDYPDRPWEMREVEHSLCEYDKYRRAQEGGKLKRRYQ